jgi:hypothetical protein
MRFVNMLLTFSFHLMGEFLGQFNIHLTELRLSIKILYIVTDLLKAFLSNGSVNTF